MAKQHFHVEIATPEAIFYAGEAVMAEFRTIEGEMGVYPGHMPMTVLLIPGIFTIREENGIRQADIASGFVEIQTDRLVVLAQGASWREEEKEGG